MEQATYESPSLLMLNDDCLRGIFTFLELEQFVHLAVTCTRLLCVAQQCKKFKNIEVEKYYDEDDDAGSSYTVEQFAKILSVIGWNVASVVVAGEAFPTLKTIADTKSGVTDLDSYYSDQIDGRSESCGSKSLQGQLPFRNLKKLIFGFGVVLSTDDWRNCFENNRRIESLEYWDRGVNKCLPLLQILSELKSLKIIDLELLPEEFHHLSGLTSLTKLSFLSEDACNNQLLLELAEKLNLVELDFHMSCYEDTFTVFTALKSFRLEVLSLSFYYGFDVPENTMFPTMLKKIRFYNLRISCSNFLSIVKQLTLLEEFDINDKGEIYNDEGEYFSSSLYWSDDCHSDIRGSKIISLIANALRVEKRKLKIIVDVGGPKYLEVWKYSDNLEIIDRGRNGEGAFDHTFRLQ